MGAGSAVFRSWCWAAVPALALLLAVPGARTGNAAVKKQVRSTQPGAVLRGPARAAAPAPRAAKPVSARTNVLIVMIEGSRSGEVAEIVKSLDVPMGEEQQTTVYRLRYGKAPRIAAALASVFQLAMPEADRRAVPPAGPPRQPRGSVVADPDTNSVIVTAEGGLQRRVAGLVAQLDMPVQDSDRP